jgi:hypothetical protein
MAPVVTPEVSVGCPLWGPLGSPPGGSLGAIPWGDPLGGDRGPQISPERSFARTQVVLNPSTQPRAPRPGRGPKPGFGSSAREQSLWTDGHNERSVLLGVSDVGARQEVGKAYSIECPAAIPHSAPAKCAILNVTILEIQ